MAIWQLSKVKNHTVEKIKNFRIRCRKISFPTHFTAGKKVREMCEPKSVNSKKKESFEVGSCLGAFDNHCRPCPGF